MQTPFADAIVGLKQVPATDLVKQIHAVFESITYLTPESAIAAYQTLEVLIKSTSDPEGLELAETFLKAIEKHMVRLWRAERDPSLQHDLHRNFRRIIRTSGTMFIFT